MPDTPPNIRRFSFSLTPAEPLFSKIIEASQQVTERYDNRNIIDHKTFPPHLSLHICTLPDETVRTLETTFSNVSQDARLFPLLELEGVTQGSSGYISVGVKRTEPLMRLHRTVIELAAKARQTMAQDPRPHHRPLSPDAQDRYQKYGNAYVLDQYEPHLSVAKVDGSDQAEAHDLVQGVLRDSRSSDTAAFELVDIGMNNEKWVPVLTLPSTS